MTHISLANCTGKPALRKIRPGMIVWQLQAWRLHGAPCWLFNLGRSRQPCTSELVGRAPRVKSCPQKQHCDREPCSVRVCVRACVHVCAHVCAWATSLLTELIRALAKRVSLFSGCFRGWFFYIEIAPKKKKRKKLHRCQILSVEKGLSGTKIIWFSAFILIIFQFYFQQLLFFLLILFKGTRQQISIFLVSCVDVMLSFWGFPRQKDTFLSLFPLWSLS